MAEFTFPEDDFDRYIIGFTENQYHGGDTLSPTPCDSPRGYHSARIDYAERSNRGKEKNFLDRSVHLEKQKSRSVSKIHTNILDLWHELAERRKSTPSLSRSLTMADFPRPISRQSDSSDGSGETSSSMPIIEVQQLPPRPKHMEELLPWARNDSFEPSNINVKGGTETKLFDKTPTTGSSQSKRVVNDKSVQKEQSTKRNHCSEPRLIKVVDELLQKHRNSDGLKTQKAHNDNAKNGDTKPSTANENEQNEINASQTISVGNKFKSVTRNIIKAQKRIKELDVKLTESEREILYRSGGNTSGSTIPKLSYCQSSYQERMEKRRVSNIQRRHQSQTNTGPLDFNKLKKQITLSRSRTVVF